MGKFIRSFATGFFAVFVLGASLAFAGDRLILGSGTATETPTYTGNKTITGNLHVTGSSQLDGNAAISSNGAASTPALHLNGSIYTGGTNTTTMPKLYITNPGANASTTLPTSGTQIGTNAATSFTGRMLGFMIDGVAKFVVRLGSLWASPPSTSVLTGSVDPTASTTLTGVGTKFLSELMIGDKVLVTGETRTVVAIASDTSLTVDTATTDTANDTSVDRYPVGISLTPADSSVGTDIFVNPAVKSSGNYLDFQTANASKFSVLSTGAVTALAYNSTTTAPGATGAYRSNAALGNAGNSVFSFYGKPAIHSAGTDLEAFRAIPDLSNNHTGGNWISYSAPNLVSADADIVKYGVRTGTGYDWDFSAPYVSKKSFIKTPLTNNSATDLFTITLAAGESVSGRIGYGVTVTGGSSDIQEHAGGAFFVCTNKGGTFSNAINEDYTNATDTVVKTAGTLAETWAMKAGNVCTVTLNINSNLSSAVNTVQGEIIVYGPVKPMTMN